MLAAAKDVDIWVLVLALVGAVLAGVALVQSKLTSIVAWAVLAVAVGLAILAWK